jgi:hypothetical protein
MFRTFTLFGLVLLAAGPTLRAEPPVATKPAPPADPPKLPAAFARSIDLGGRPIDGVELKEALRILRVHNCTVTLDEAAFEKLRIKGVGQTKVSLPTMPSAPAGFVAEMIAHQVDGTIRLDGEQLTLVPGKPRDLKTLIGPPNPAIVAALVKNMTLDKPVIGAPLKDIVDFLSDKYSLTIVVDEWAFAKAGTKHVLDSQCSLANGTLPLKGLFVVLASMVNGVPVVGEELIVIVPDKKDR